MVHHIVLDFLKWKFNQGIKIIRTANKYALEWIQELDINL